MTEEAHSFILYGPQSLSCLPIHCGVSGRNHLAARNCCNSQLVQACITQDPDQCVWAFQYLTCLSSQFQINMPHFSFQLLSLKKDPVLHFYFSTNSSRNQINIFLGLLNLRKLSSGLVWKKKIKAIKYTIFPLKNQVLLHYQLLKGS